MLSVIRYLQVIGAPLAAGLLALDGWLGLAGWQWLFIVEGIPTILMGLYTKVNLAESPAKATFLTAPEKAWLQQRHAESKVLHCFVVSNGPMQMHRHLDLAGCFGLQHISLI